MILLMIITIIIRDGSKAATTSKMERFGCCSSPRFASDHSDINNSSNKNNKHNNTELINDINNNMNNTKNKDNSNNNELNVNQNIYGLIQLYMDVFKCTSYHYGDD